MTAVQPVEWAKYGSRLFLNFLLVVILGAGGLGLGIKIALPEVTNLLGSGTVSEAELAGGAILAFLGAVILLAGLFGLAYKLIADAVAAGHSASTGRGAQAETAPTEATQESSAAAATAPQQMDEPVDKSTPEQPTARDTGGSIPSVEASGQQPKSTAGGASEPGTPSQPRTDHQSETEPSGDERPGTEQLAENIQQTDVNLDQQESFEAAETDARSQTTDPGPDQQTADEGGEEWFDSAAPRDGPTEDPSVEQSQDRQPMEPSPEEIAFGSDDGNDVEDSETNAGANESRESTEPAASDASSDPLADPNDEE